MRLSSNEVENRNHCTQLTVKLPPLTLSSGSVPGEGDRYLSLGGERERQRSREGETEREREVRTVKLILGESFLMI